MIATVPAATIQRTALVLSRLLLTFFEDSSQMITKPKSVYFNKYLQIMIERPVSNVI